MTTTTVAVLGTPLIAIVTLYFNDLWRRDDRTAERTRAQDAREAERERTREAREAERERARDARLFDHLRTTYVELLRVVYTMATVVERKHPLIDYGQPMPDLPDEETMRAVSVAATALGSEEVMAGMDAVMNSWFEFLQDADVLTDRLETTQGSDLAAARSNVDNARNRFRANVTELERLVRSELRA